MPKIFVRTHKNERLAMPYKASGNRTTMKKCDSLTNWSIIT